MAINPGELLYAELYEKEHALAMTPAGLAYLSFVRAHERLEAGRFQRALDLLNVADRLLPEGALPRWRCAFRFNRAICNLGLGNYRDGFVEAEFRKVFNPHPGDRLETAEWRGEPIMAKRLLVYQEMGFGDVVMLLRYLPTLKAMDGDITLMIAAPLHRLVEQFGVKVVGELVEGRDYDYRVPFFGLMPILKQTLDTIPNAPYLRWPDPYPLPPTHKQRIGIAWSGNPNFDKNILRSIALEQLLARLDCDDCELYSLQIGDAEHARELGVNVVEIRDFADTASLIAAMDHVVCVDTAPIHVAGAMGHASSHVLLPFAQEWRWYFGKRWYPTLHMHRQKDLGNWSAAFASVNTALRRSSRREDRPLRRVG